MILFYVIFWFFNGGFVFSIVYWMVVIIVVIIFILKVWRRIVIIFGIKRNFGKKIGLEIVGVWVIGVVFGWVLIFLLNLGINEEVGLVVGFLSFISVLFFG